MPEHPALPTDPTDRVRYVLKRIALELDPAGELKLLADHYAWSPSTISQWISRGWVPARVAKALCKRFGTRIGFNVTDLCPNDAE